MTTDEIKNLISTGIESSQVTVSGEGGMFDTIVISEKFDGLSPVKKQQMVYATVNDHISNGDIHALSIKAYTPDEWKTASKLQIG
ncbi:MAG: BolA family transcriptional regulator [gamma proteobacterium symbiont of Taylorina sp.]|nr:BolA family transcriptional regulator [gamma proteobacterium symbiont of Taylorina sp.]